MIIEVWTLDLAIKLGFLAKRFGGSAEGSVVRHKTEPEPNLRPNKWFGRTLLQIYLRNVYVYVKDNIERFGHYLNFFGPLKSNLFVQLSDEPRF